MTTALERDLEACERATEGPWEQHRDSVRYEAPTANEHDDGFWHAEMSNWDDAEFVARARTRWLAALRVVQAVAEMRRVFGDDSLPLAVRDALRAFEDETT